LSAIFNEHVDFDGCDDDDDDVLEENDEREVIGGGALEKACVSFNKPPLPHTDKSKRPVINLSLVIVVIVDDKYCCPQIFQNCCDVVML
jgi:hypothetical protein